ncbi:MAG: Stp1/IreP family PP2C-type Ser/Thr phosphatase [Hydrogenophaga sp.]|uniref:Stp1/IreP family PP2C-type Ser/Thr phosphatase n=1 Tax=Hydrogenophaga sp. TaxID=1904254 RepID=UPI002778E234|nr:Stp1/IreP family PP2C-type Ser/Thr phosphatase [Hydrogenophaga sp.]MDP2418281.1 Stp1/IreP family PP2C-type Ser/Thr phosphatase [Hydrogenophaga sp.]MDZ4190189.1 Stp1/IreP family PP2C-type Ser/Thr phosphatase [Hydrogenophaga sp.]
MMYEYFCLTDTGRLRESNEDSVVFDPDNQVVVLADGMGGYNAGEVASVMATTFIKTELGRWLAEGGAQASAREIKRAMEICVDNANRSIFNAANSNSQYEGMGTTLVMGVFQGSRALIGHVGDSRCYRLRGNSLVQLTRDHSLLQEQIDAGLISLEQAQYATHKNLVTRALGVEDTVLLEVNEYRAEEGDLYVLCSDGLSDMVTDGRIAALLVSTGTLEEKCKALIDAANGNGGRDNISVILAFVRSLAARRGLFARMLRQ